MQKIELPAIHPQVVRALARRSGGAAWLLAIKAAKKSLYPVSWIASFVYPWVLIVYGVMIAGCVVVMGVAWQDGNRLMAFQILLVLAGWGVVVLVVRRARTLYMRVNFPAQWRAERQDWL